MICDASPSSRRLVPSSSAVKELADADAGEEGEGEGGDAKVSTRREYGRWTGALFTGERAPCPLPLLCAEEEEEEDEEDDDISSRSDQECRIQARMQCKEMYLKWREIYPGGEHKGETRRES